MLRLFGNGDGVVQRDHRRRVRIVRQKYRGKELVLRTCPVKWPAQRVGAAYLLGRQPLHFAIGHVLDFLRRIRRRSGFVTQAGRPHRIRRHYFAALRDFCFYRNNISVAELEGLADSGVAVGILVGQLARSGDAAARAGHIERGVDLVAQILVVGIKAERQAKLGGILVDHVQRIAVVVLELLQHPRLHLRPFVGEDNAIEVVLDRGLDFFAGSLRDYSRFGSAAGGLARGLGRCSGRCGLGSDWSALSGFCRLMRRLGRGIFLEQEDLGEDDERNHDGEHHHHVLVAATAAVLLGIAIFSQVLDPTHPHPRVRARLQPCQKGSTP